MAQRILTTLIDDMDGSEGVATITFGWEGRTLEIDLNEKNAEKIRKAILPFVAKARIVRSSSASKIVSITSKQRAATGAGSKSGDARAWGQSPSGQKILAQHGVSAPGSRGRMDTRVLDLYEESLNNPKYEEVTVEAPAPEAPVEAPEAPKAPEATVSQIDAPKPTTPRTRTRKASMVDGAKTTTRRSPAKKAAAPEVAAN